MTLLQINGRFPFAPEKLRGVLKKHGIKVKTATQEADDELGNLGRNGKAFAVLAEESDFLAMSGVRYIPFRELSFYQYSQNLEQMRIRVRVFSSEMVAASLGLAVDQSLYPLCAARWVTEHIPVLQNPILSQIEAQKKEFLRALFEIYRFYGHAAAFLNKFPMRIEPNLPPNKLELYKKMIDSYSFPLMAIDILETKGHKLNQRFDALASVSGLKDKSLDELQAPVRHLSYLVLDTPVVKEETVRGYVEVHVVPLESLDPLISVPIQSRSGKAVGRTFRSLMFVFLYGDSSGRTRRDRTHLKNRSLPDDKLLELLLLTSLISFTVDSSDQKSTDLELTVFDERLLSMEIYAAVGGYLETLKQLHHLRLLLGSKLPPNSGCSTYFSGEVFLKVCHTLMQSTRSSSTAGKSTKSASGLSCRAVESVISKFAEISDRKRFWSHYTNIRGAMQRMKELVALPSGVARANVASKSAATAALENTMRSNGYISVDGFDLRPPDATPPLPLSSPSHLQTSVNARSVRGLMTSKPTERTSTDNAVEPEPEPSTSVSLKGMMQTLPVFDHREEILKNVAINQLTIIQGETGCGKSTSVPQFFYNAWARAKASFERPVNIYVTQPRRIAAIELSNTVARMREGNAFDEVGQVGQVVGYRIGQKHVTSSKTKITYVTTGYMVERIIHDPEALTKITHLVLDEVHERSMDVDLLLLLLKLKFKNHPQVRVVIMSATMDAKLLIHYLANALAARLVNRKPLCVGSKLYPVEDIYLDKLSDHFPGLSQRGQQDLVLMKDQFKRLSKPQHMTNSKLARKSIMNIHDNQLKLIKEMVRCLIREQTQQIESQSHINKLFESISFLDKRARGQNVQIKVLHSEIELGDQREAFKLLGVKSTKIVLSTNIAESSVTIPDVTHVINCAVEKQIELSSVKKLHAEVLKANWCSKDSSIQRSGRAGRVMPGKAFHLFTKAFHGSCMAQYTTPELLRKPLDRVILQFTGRLSEFKVPSSLLRGALDAPDLSHIDNAYRLLASFDAIDSEDEKDSRLTRFGSFVCHLPLSLQLCRLLMTGVYTVQDNTDQVESCPLLLHTVILVSILSTPDLFIMLSFYHIRSAQTYLKEMKKNLQAKLKLDGGMWSEPLSIWLFYMETMSDQQINIKSNLRGIFHKFAISSRRYQTLNYLISDLCQRLISLSQTPEFSQLIYAKGREVLTKLETYASTQRVDKKLLKFARDTVSGKRDECVVFGS
ncbi:hypothetical protein F444_22377 [Phytophthora nicotianae P1976]|uniref:Helicase ATP-binding domain-containing protein n=1 Tax=Phytophthora nicotianae P1976 TaxID=1317066 RepID=A0A080YXY9_PHYNI|nr:hypothetical protein F444_22377 [Phytophthora nicotianae P1976]